MPVHTALRFPQRPRLGGLGRNTLLTTSGLVLRAALQAGYLIALSRWLGADGYGLFAGSVAAVILLAPLSNWGLGFVFTEHAADGTVARTSLWHSIVVQAAIKGVLFALLAIAVTHEFMLVRVTLVDLVLLALAELLALPMAQMASQVQVALRRGGAAALTTCLVPAFRLAGAFALIASDTLPAVHAIAMTHFVGSLVGAAAALLITSRALAHNDAKEMRLPPGWRALLRDGAPYAFGALAAGAYLEIDKVLILQLVGADAAGAYTAAFRVVMVFALPITALLNNVLPRLFVAERTGQGARLLNMATTVSVGYALVGAALALMAAPWVPLLFGPGYEPSSRYMAMLAAWLPLFALHLCGATALVAAGGKAARLIVEAGGLMLVIALNLVMLPRMGASGAAASLLAAELVMSLACWVLLARARRAASIRP